MLYKYFFSILLHISRRSPLHVHNELTKMSYNMTWQGGNCKNIKMKRTVSLTFASKYSPNLKPDFLLSLLISFPLSSLPSKVFDSKVFTSSRGLTFDTFFNFYTLPTRSTQSSKPTLHRVMSRHSTATKQSVDIPGISALPFNWLVWFANIEYYSFNFDILTDSMLFKLEDFICVILTFVIFTWALCTWMWQSVKKIHLPEWKWKGRRQLD